MATLQTAHLFKMNFPEIVDLALPAEGVVHNLVFLSIKKTYPMDSSESLFLIHPIHPTLGFFGVIVQELRDLWTLVLDAPKFEFKIGGGLNQ